MKLPKTMGACADLLYSTRQRRLAVQRQVEALEAEESLLREHIIKTLPKSDASGVAGRLARVTVVTNPVPQVKDWARFYAYVKKTGRFDLMQRRVATKAIGDMLEAGDRVPGVEVFKAVTVSINKV